MNPLSYTVDQVCAATGMGRTRIYEVIDSGELPAKKFGKRTLVLKPDLVAFLTKLEAYPVREGGQNA